MTPEQEILEDALVAARQRTGRFTTELKEHARSLPLDPHADWSDPSPELQMDMAAFSKRYEMTQDIIIRRLFRSVLAVSGIRLRTKALADAMRAIADLGIIADVARWEEIVKLRNGLAHDYALSFAGVAPMLNQAWIFAPDLIDMVDRVGKYVAEHKLLAPVEDESCR